MEEDIKIIEEMIKRLDKNCFDIYRKAKNTEDYLGTITGKEIISIENLLNRLKTAERMNDELIKLRTALQKEYNCAIEGFMKKQISTSVVDGTIAQETGWILNELDKILGNGQERR